MKVYPIFLLSLLAVAHSPTFSACGAGVDPIAFPIKVAAGKHTFADAKDQPFFWLGTTQWELFRGYSLEDARTILERTQDNGFTVVQVKLLGQGDGNRANVYGHTPLLNGDALTPNESYFTNVDAVVKSARDNNLAIQDDLRGVTITFSANDAPFQVKGPLVNAEWVGVLGTVGQTIEDRYGKPLEVITDLNGRKFARPMSGPLSDLKTGPNTIVWPIKPNP